MLPCPAWAGSFCNSLIVFSPFITLPVVKIEGLVRTIFLLLIKRLPCAARPSLLKDLLLKLKTIF
jgi:predicted transporter